MASITHPRASLLGLPPKLRTYIFELVLFHCASAGIIAPISDRHSENLRAHRLDWAVESITLIEGERMRIDTNGKPTYFRSTARQRGTMAPEQSQKECEELESQYRVFDASANGLHDHLCTLDCLLQPELTKASRQVREETLPIFYGVNSFHLELSNFHIGYNSRTLKPLRRSPTDWWRAMGDTNLRCTKSLTLVGHPSDSRPEAGLIFTYSSRGDAAGRVDIVQHEYIELGDDEKAGTEDAEEVLVLKKKAAALRKGARLDPHFECARGSGLHVRVLEQCLSILEPEKGRYLRDRSALGTVGSGVGSGIERQAELGWMGYA